MELVCISRSHTNTPLEKRESLRFSVEEIEAFLPRLQADLGLPEVVLVSTCNRVEVYFFGCTYYHLQQVPLRLGTLRGQAPWLPEEYATFVGEDAANHLFQVAAGLVSQVKGENEILGQLKNSFQISHDAKTTGMLTSEIFHRAFRTGKRVRTETEFCSGGTSVGTVAVSHAAKEAQPLAELGGLVIGAGDIAQLATRTLSHRSPKTLIVANRSVERAAMLTEKYGGEAVDLDSLPEVLASSDVVFSATGATGYILTPEMIPAERTKPLWIYDLALPRDVDPAVANHPAVCLRNLDDLQPLINDTLKRREAEIPEVEAIIAEECASFRDWRRELAAVPSIQRLLTIGEETLVNELDPLRDSLPGDEFSVVQQTSRRIMKTLMREIITELKRTARAAGAQPQTTTAPTPNPTASPLPQRQQK